MLRLKQQYFFVSAGVQSIIEHYKNHYGNVSELPDFIAIHINDTHPALAVPELMRILIDEEGLGWDEAWDVTVRTISYTNHTILPEALERWPVEVFSGLLPRIFMIVCEINKRFCAELSVMKDFDSGKVSRMAIISGGVISMAHLSIVGSHAINGVAKVHSNLLKYELFRDFYELYPDRFSNKTNGITHRRWVQLANPALTNLISSAIGGDWIEKPLKLSLLDESGGVRDSAFL
jgi:starch phosphorylase